MFDALFKVSDERQQELMQMVQQVGDPRYSEAEILDFVLCNPGIDLAATREACTYAAIQGIALWAVPYHKRKQQEAHNATP